jgi:hypothetical protein
VIKLKDGLSDLEAHAAIQESLSTRATC